ncbi:MarR family winged helix-turn-helix transcriptional regulator [Actinocrispum wychmicini]|uniref:DNA-binding MarR family transcriptional regulator n=1 Tax=Actinocrispum wychmicini TaxID=1213861 RepID=A0A4R2JJ19_9PSEU|nr:MarR family transcriptional regulator [Actinocrispum wychmicini]TCO57006.1 DNA-binding MarR family transcriptional regulator [Actinocrispum wychmicini]
MTSEQQAFDIVIALHRLLRTLRHAVRNTSLQPTQVLVLSQLVGYGPMRVGELAARVPCSQPTATVAVTSLESTGYVRREPDPADGRAIRVVATDEGREVLISLAQGEARELVARLDLLDPADLADLDRLAPLLTKLATPMESLTRDARARLTTGT